jgi:hypothetical protein
MFRALRVQIAVLVLILSAGIASVSASSAPPVDTVGLVDTSTGVWHLYDNGNEFASFTYGNPGDVPFMGDWDGDGIETPGLYRQSDGFVYLRNSNTVGNADITFFFGNPNDVPIAGDFNGNGFDTVSIYRPSNQTFYIINELGEDGGGLGPADTSYVFGDPGDKPFVGDFNGNGQETVGLHRESTGLVYYRNTHTPGNADNQFIFGDPGDRFVAGDWTGNGTDTPGVFRPGDSTFYVRFSNSAGPADISWSVGDRSWIPVAGRLSAATTPPPPTTTTTTTTTTPPVVDPVTITLAGDMGAGAGATATLIKISSLAPEAHFVLGDLKYDDLPSESDWCTYVKDIIGTSLPFELLTGNHEDSGPHGYIRNFTACLPDKLNAVGDYGVQYYTDIGGLVRVVAISPDLTIDGKTYRYTPGSSERIWLENAVADARSQGLWVVLAQHKPCISSAEYSCDITEELADWEAANVDVITMGHAHNYQRSHQLSCVDVNKVTPACIADTDSVHAQGDGAVYVIVGVAGRLRSVNPGDPESGYFAALMGSNSAESGHGLLELTIAQDRIDATFVGSDTSYSDSFAITR